MGLETANWVTQLNNSNPVDGDPVGEGDDHLRMLKTVLKNSFPSSSTSAIVPNMSGQSGKYLTTDGTDSTWSDIPPSGVQLDNSEPWTHAQYNTLIDASITSDGTALPRAMLGSIQSNPNQKISPASGGAFTVCNVFGDAPTKVGIYANLLLDPVATYTFDTNNFLVNDIDESKWLYVRLLSDNGKWKQIGANFLGEAGGLGGGSDVYTEHLNASVEDTTIVSTNNALSAGPVQLDNVVTVESGATWVIV